MRTAFRQPTPTRNYSRVQWGYSDSNLLFDKPRQALTALICCGQHVAVSMPGHGDLIAIISRMSFSFDALGTNYIDSSWGQAFCKNCGRMANLRPTRVECRKTDENIRKLSQAFTMSEINQDIQHLLLVLRKRQKRWLFVGKFPWIFDHYASQVRTLLASFQAFFRGYYARVVPVLVPPIDMSFFFEHPIFVWN